MDAIRINTDSVWTADGFPFSQAVVEPSGRRVHLAGQVGWTTEHEIVGIDDAQAQTDYAIDNIERVLSALGGKLTDVVSLTMYYSRDSDLQSIQEVRGRRFDRYQDRRLRRPAIARRADRHSRHSRGSLQALTMLAD